MKEKICIECGKYPSEYAQTICEFCMGITNKDDYIEQLQQEKEELKEKIELRNKEKTDICNKLEHLMQLSKRHKKEITNLIAKNIKLKGDE